MSKASKERYKFAMSEAERICKENRYTSYRSELNPFTEGKGTESQERKFKNTYNTHRSGYLSFIFDMHMMGMTDEQGVPLEGSGLKLKEESV